MNSTAARPPIRSALKACPSTKQARFQAEFAAALAVAARNDDNATLQEVLRRWQPGGPCSSSD